MSKFWTKVALTLTFLSLTSGFEVIDLTYDVGDDSIYWPIYPPVNFTILQRGVVTDTDLYLEYNMFGMAEHTSTHADAPAHFIQNGWRAHLVPPSRLVGPGVVIDVTMHVHNNHTYRLTVQDVLEWETRYGRIPEHSVVFVRTGWGERYPNKTLVFNSETGDNSDPSTYRFPTIGKEAAGFLANNRSLLAVAVDVPSPDLSDPVYPAHVAFLSQDVLILENVAQVDRLPTKGFTVVVGMIKLHDGSGGPSRVLAITGTINPNTCPTGGAVQHVHSAIFTLLATLTTLVVLLY